MKRVELYGRVRYSVLVEGISRRQAALTFGIDRRTVDKMLVFSVPLGYHRKEKSKRPNLDAFTGVFDQIPEADKQVRKRKRHTSKQRFLLGINGVEYD